MTVTSELSDHYDKLHARAERTQEQEREDKAAPSGGSHKDPERERRWVLLKIPRCDIDGVGEGK